MISSVYYGSSTPDSGVRSVIAGNQRFSTLATGDGRVTACHSDARPSIIVTVSTGSPFETATFVVYVR